MSLILLVEDHPDLAAIVGDHLEAAGHEYDALWICGLARELWPAPAKPDPFIPLALQQELQRQGDAVFILDDKYGLGHLSVSSCRVTRKSRRAAGHRARSRAIPRS